MADDWGGIPVDAAEPAATAPKTDAWGGVAVEEPRTPFAGPTEPGTEGFAAGATPTFADPAMGMRLAAQGVGHVLKAFATGAEEGAGEGPLGFSQDSMNFLIKSGVFRPDNRLDNPKAIFQAFNEGVLYPAAAMLDAAVRTPQAIYRGLQGAGVAIGLPRDLVSMPDAFMGAPGMFKAPEPFVKPSAIRPVEYAEAPTPSLQATPPPDSGMVRFYHGGHEYSGGPRWLTTNIDYARTGYTTPGVSGPSKTGRFLHYVDIPETSPALVKDFDDTNTFQKSGYSAFHAPEDIAKNLKPYIEKSPEAESGGAAGGAEEAERALQAIERAMDLPPSRSSAALTGIPEVDAVTKSAVTQGVIDHPVIDRSYDVPYMAGGSKKLSDPTVYIDRHVPTEQTAPRLSDPSASVTFDPADAWIVHENVEQHAMEMLIAGGMDAQTAYRVAHFEYAEKAEQAWYRAHDIDQVAAEKEQLSWLPRIQHESPANPPPNLYTKPYPHAHVAEAQHEAVTEAPPTPEEVARAHDIIANGANAGPDLGQARALGVTGEERPTIDQGSPEEAGRNAAPPTGPPGRPRPGEPGGPPEEPSVWRQRFEATLDKMETPAEAKALIMNAVDRNNEFELARQGELPPAQVEALAQATGIDAAKIDPAKTGALVKTSDQMRNIVQALRSLDDKIRDVSQQIAAKAGGNDEAEIEALARLQLQRNTIVDQAVEPFVAFRAEFGRAGNVLQEFMRARREGAELDDALRNAQGRSPDDLRGMARMIAATPQEALAQTIAKMRPGSPPGKLYWTWVNGLISGPLTHTKYVAANALYLATERGVVTPLAALIGKAKAIMGAEGERVFLGETAAGAWAAIAATPTAFLATARAVKAGMPVALESEITLFNEAVARGEKPPTPIANAVARAELPRERPITGIWGRIIGAPGDAATGIHTFFKILGHDASAAAVAYRQALAERGEVAGGALGTPADYNFGQRVAWWRANMTPAMRTEAVADAYKGTFMSELGPTGKSWSHLTKTNPVLKWVFPFAHIPLNLMKATYEASPFAPLSLLSKDSDLSATLRGEKGGAAQDKAIARMVVGSSIMGYFTYKAMAGQATGDYPTDPKERDAWNLAGKQPNSILIGNYWVSFNKFGPAGDLANIGANIAQVIHTAQKPDDDAWTSATWRAAHAAGHVIGDEVGFQSLQNLFEAMRDEKKGASWASSFASSFIPFSSFVSQTASAADPYMRDTKSFVDGLKYRVPMLRDTLLPKRDWLGQPLANPQYGNIIRKREAITDPVNQEMIRLEIHPAPPQDRIGGVKLTPALYDRYQAAAGPLTQRALDTVVNSPHWSTLPDYVRSTVIHNLIEGARKQAAFAIQAAHPQIIRDGIQQRLDFIQGTTHTARPKRAPADLEGVVP